MKCEGRSRGMTSSIWILTGVLLPSWMLLCRLSAREVCIPTFGQYETLQLNSGPWKASDLTHAMMHFFYPGNGTGELFCALRSPWVCSPLRSAVCNVYRHGGDGGQQWGDLLQQIRLRFHQKQILSRDGEEARGQACRLAFTLLTLCK